MNFSSNIIARWVRTTSFDISRSLSEREREKERELRILSFSNKDDAL